MYLLLSTRKGSQKTVIQGLKKEKNKVLPDVED